MVLRSDEAANQAEVERDMSVRSNVKKGIATAATLTGTGAALGSGLASKIMPFINKYVPTALAMKGIDKVSPEIGKFLKKGQELGLNVEDGLKFVKDKITNENADKPAKEDRNIIEQYSPELNQFLSEKIKGGEDPIKAAALALFQKGTNFEPAIRQIEKDHKTNWSQVVQSIFGSQTSPATQQNQQQTNQGGAGQQALMDILNRINQSLGQ